MKTLFLMRHAKSSWKDLSLADHERPLNQRGKRDAPRMGRFIQGQGVELDAILCSPAKRARATLEGFLEEFTFEDEARIEEGLYHAGLEGYFELLGELEEEIERVMLIGHNPTMDFFLDVVCEAHEHMVTACIAQIELAITEWEALKAEPLGELVNLWKPREIEA